MFGSLRGWNSRQFAENRAPSLYRIELASHYNRRSLRLMIVGRIMKSDWEVQWESWTIDELFALREQMQDVLSAKLKAKKVELERRLRIINQRSSDVGLVKPGDT